MNFSKIYSAQPALLKADVISVEIDVSKGLHSFSIVGLPDKAVEEARDRVSAAIKNTGYKPPKSKNEKIVVSLAPADVRKEGPLFDLAIALAYLKSSGDVKFDAEGKIFLGELSLDGAVRPVKGVLPMTRECKRLGFKEVFVPKENAAEAALIEGINIYGISSLKETVGHLEEKPGKKIPPEKHFVGSGFRQASAVDLRDIRGQQNGKRGLEIAAAGGHNIAFYGPPGTGKTLLARAFSGILPDLDIEESLEVTSIHSVAGILKGNIARGTPFRAPHHTASYVSIIGGGATPKPGEVTLAHRGVLFLDEFPEFDKRVLESLRQPLEDRVVNVSRAKGFAVFPAHFILIAAMNPCPCGNLGSKEKRCVCAPKDIARYRRKLSGPIMDRIDIWIEVGHMDYEKLSEKASGEESLSVRKRVEETRKIQLERFRKHKNKLKTNSEIGIRSIENLAPLEEHVRAALNESARKLNLSPRAYHKTIKVARTIADMHRSENIGKDHILEAISYRPKND